MNRLLRNLLILVLVASSAGCAATGPLSGGGPSDAALLATLPPMDREFRGVWVATVANIDWPPAPGLSTEEQKASMRRLLDHAAYLNMNAVILQIRPMSDALYDSPFEPWSYYLTGEQGLAPDPFYDPLAFAIDEAHRRGMELHAWFNPFRAWHITTGDSLSALHVRERRPDSVVEYGDQTWMDPGSRDAVEHSLAVIMDVVDRYDVDGVHLDDYFYPYPVQDSTGAGVEFPDEGPWLELDRADSLRAAWRRSNVDMFIHRLYLGVKARKPWVKVGISPFGIWRPGYPEGIVGFDAYEGLYADARRWMQEGWADYFSPQLYWSLDSSGQPYDRLLDWWVDQNAMNRHLWPGLFTSRVILDGAAHWDPPEIVRQVEHTRTVSGVTGNVHFSMRALTPADHGMGTAVRTRVYEEPALVPASPWLGEDRPGRPTAAIVMTASGPRLELGPSGNDTIRVWAVQQYVDGSWLPTILPAATVTMMLHEDVRAVSVQAVNRLGRASEPELARRPQ